MMQTLESTQFNWDGNTGSADASDLGLTVRMTMPQNFLVKSSKTGSTLRFEYTSQEIVDGDLLWETYLAVSAGKFVTITVFND